MRFRMLRVPALILGLVSPLLLAPLEAQWLSYPTADVPRTPDGKPNLSAACPRLPDGHPDLSGLWVMQTKREGNANFPGCEPVSDEFINIAASLKGGLPYQPWAAELVNKRRTEQRVNDPMSRCVPIGPVRLHTWNGPRKLLQSHGLLIIMNELDTTYRQIFTDGRPLPRAPNPSWNGYSSGTWEGDTLVVQTSGFRDGIWLDATGNPMTDVAKLVERFHRPDFGHLDVAITVDDPKAYTKPWTVTLRQVISLDTDLLDFVCADDEKDVPHLSSK
ncbi:MAG TPA: hypothetical protein VKV17_13820 [Bryobacteraceae bacterium]|nr:hypothetical protein [Bryobacteraceae bacterium]